MFSIISKLYIKNMNYSSRKAIVSILMGALFLGSCSNNEQTEEKVIQQTYSVTLKGITVSGEESSEELKDVSVFSLVMEVFTRQNS